MSATPEIKHEVARKRSLTAALAAKFDMEPGMFLDTIKKTVMPSSASNEEVAAFLMVAKEYDMNPLLREIHAFQKKGGGIQTVVGVDGWAKIITRNHDFDGVEFEYQENPNGPLSVTCIMFRKSCSRPTKVTEYYDECKRNTEPWNTMPRRMLRHKALMQCGRIAFGLSGIVDEDEARDFCEVDAVVVDDPLTPGRHERKRSKKTETAINEPEKAAEPVDELITENLIPDAGNMVDDNGVLPDACKEYLELMAANEKTPALVKRALEKAALKHDPCSKLRSWNDLDHTDTEQCCFVLTEYRRVRDLAQGK